MNDLDALKHFLAAIAELADENGEASGKLCGIATAPTIAGYGTAPQTIAI